MAESETRDWVLVWVEDLHRRAGSKRFWEKEQEWIDLGRCCLILSCSLWEQIFHPDQYSLVSDSLLFLIQPLDSTFYKILSVLNIMMTVDSLFLPKAALLSIYLLLKPLS